MSATTQRSLEGLSTGDAFGQLFFSPHHVVTHDAIAANAAPPGPWMTTDDTEMAVALCEVLGRHGRVDQDDLAATFARRFMADPERGYGGTARRILTDTYCGTPWRDAAAGAFGGMGSMGNGSAMRVAPLGAFFAHDTPLLVEQARLSAEVTHAHPDAHAGAVAVARAASFAARHAGQHSPRLVREFLDFVLDHTPDSDTRAKIAIAADIPRSYDVRTAVSTLGNGTQLSCPDTVPLCIWLAARHYDDYARALWHTVTAAGDIDTNCAIVGGIVALSTQTPIPDAWLHARGPLRPTAPQ